MPYNRNDPVNVLGDPTFVVDRNFAVTETREALKTFFAPFSGVVKAVKSKKTHEPQHLTAE